MNTQTAKTRTPKALAKAFVGPVAPAATPVAPTLPVKPAAPTLAAPCTAAALAAALLAPHACTYAIGAKAAVIAPHLTLQRGCTVPVGVQWRANGHKAPNTRHIVINLLSTLGATFTHADALAALAPLKADATLGSGTPASYIRAFVKCGYLVPMAAKVE